MNDMFLFMENSNFYNYAFDNFVARSSPELNAILSHLEYDICRISLKWFDDNGVNASPSTVKFMIMSSEYTEPHELTKNGDACLHS